MDSNMFRMAAKSATGLEEITAEELIQLGAKDIRLGVRAVEFSGDKELLYKANFHCRTASRILTPVGQFMANDANNLYKGINKIDWSSLSSVTSTLRQRSISGPLELLETGSRRAN